MTVAIAAIDDHRKGKKRLPRRGSVQYCDLLQQIGETAMESLDGARNKSRTADERRVLIKRVPEIVDCLPTMSVFRVPVPRRVAAPPQSGEPEVTGAYESYLDPMQAAVDASEGNPASISLALDDVLASAIDANIPQGDLLALAAFASLIESSAIEWNAYRWGETATCVSDCAPLSAFSVPVRRGDVGKVITADALGCLSAVKSWSALKLLLYSVAWQALAGECGVRGAIGSGGAILALI